MQSAYLYQVLAETELDESKQVLFSSLESAALSQAKLWEDKIRGDGGVLPPAYQPSVRARLVAFLIRRLHPRRILPVLSAMKIRGISVYRSASLPASHPMPTTIEEVGGRHRGVGSGGNLRAAVFGVNDGLVSNASLIMGVAGASGDVRIIVLSGVAGLLAGAFSMAAGEYVSMRSQRELFEYQIELEREEFALYPDEEKEELALIYNARGLSMERARGVAAEMLRDPEHALDALSREELGLNPDDLGSAWGAALSSFLSFAAGALLPLLPFLLVRNGPSALIVSIGLSGAALFGVGSGLSLFNGRSAVWGGLRMVLIGGAAGLSTYLIGTLLGVAFS
ncbi:MAG: VIT1/CCC1 transporter family protein [Nitrospirae bacterium]|nr:VIT1/CCC1 transporter family protein [Nitrospirota bacterium]